LFARLSDRGQSLLQIVIPMSGFGERFKREGYEVPKPLILVEGKPMIQHVVDLFPGNHKFIFICNEDHLNTPSFRMREIIAETGVEHVIFPIQPHKLGPVHAVLLAEEAIDKSAPIIVNYADFTCLWNFEDFVNFLDELDPDGVIPAYRGFHPHSGGSTNYAYVREANGQVIEVREKRPFTEDKTQEFASTGTYYFKSADLMLHYFKKEIELNIHVNHEFYVSSAFDLMATDDLKVKVYEIRHFMQWGTPSDLREYEYWSKALKTISELSSGSLPIRGTGATLVLASGRGERFSSAGYLIPKPLLEVSGDTILEQIFKTSDDPLGCFVLSIKSSAVSAAVFERGLARLEEIDEVSGGQADSANYLVSRVVSDYNSHFTIFPSDTLYADDSGFLEELPRTPSDEEMIVWVSRPGPFNFDNSESFGWIGVRDSEVWTSVKKTPSHDGGYVMSGTFTFSSRVVFDKLYTRLVNDSLLVNGERYLDSFVQLAVELGIGIRLFEPTFTQSLGTPYEFETFRYWQTCFDEWDIHPYELEKDVFVNPEKLDATREKLRNTRHKPSEWKNAS
jgi:NDP-sugar pyrophosphorylase family protein